MGWGGGRSGYCSVFIYYSVIIVIIVMLGAMYCPLTSAPGIVGSSPRVVGWECLTVTVCCVGGPLASGWSGWDWVVESAEFGLLVLRPSPMCTEMYTLIVSCMLVTLL